MNKNEKVRIRRARPDDAPGIRRVARNAWFTSYVFEDLGIMRHHVRYFVIARADFEEKMRWQITTRAPNDPRRRDPEKTYRAYWVATKGTQVVGFCIAAQRPNERFVHSFYVLPAYQRQGLGSELLTRALTWLGDDQPITLRVNTWSDKAIRLYKQFGFVTVGASSEAVGSRPVRYIPKLVMERPAAKK